MVHGKDDGFGRRRVLQGMGTAGLAATAGCLGGGGGQDTYQIGMVDSQTGSLSDFGQIGRAHV